MTKVDVEQVAVLRDHDVAVVAIADAHDIGRDAVPCAGEREVLHSALVLLLRHVVRAQILVERLQLERAASATAELHLDARGGAGSKDDLDHAATARGAIVGARGHNRIGREPQIHLVLEPDLVHHA